MCLHFVILGLFHCYDAISIRPMLLIFLGKFRKITKSLNESASMLEGVMKDIRAGEMEER